jgi:hypothetical protein
MFTDPGFHITKFVRPAQLLEVEFVAIEKRPFRRVRGHYEIAEFHAVLLGSSNQWT